MAFTVSSVLAMCTPVFFHGESHRIRDRTRKYQECKEIFESPYREKLSEHYASHNEIDATRCGMLAHQYIGHYGDRIEIYMRFNDEEKTLVTVIYEPANSTHSSHVDVVPCQYTAAEIRKMKR